METVNVHKAKTHLSRLLNRAHPDVHFFLPHPPPPGVQIRNRSPASA